MTEKKVSLTKKDRLSVMLRSQFLQGSWNYERMQNGGWAFSLIPALKKLYPNPEDSKAALKRHLEFFNTHPYIASPILGVTLALEEDRANGAPIDDATIQGILVYNSSYLRSDCCRISCNRFNHWTIVLLHCMELDPYCIYVVYTRIRIPSRF